MRNIIKNVIVLLATGLAAGSALAICPVGVDVLHPEDFGCSGTDMLDDTDCWRQALACARGKFYAFDSSISDGVASPINYLGTVEGYSTSNYYITDTIVVEQAFNGVIDGKGATLTWAGPPNIPMWKIADTQGLTIRNMSILATQATSGAPSPTTCPNGCRLDTGIWLTYNQDCDPAPYMNIVDNVRIDGNINDGLQYGVKISRWPGEVGNNSRGNDGHIIRQCRIGSAAKAAVYIEGQNAIGQFIENLYASSHCGPNTRCTDSYYVHLKSGTLTSIGGYGYAFDAMFYIEDAGSGAYIIDSQSEISGHLIKRPSGNSGASGPIHVQGGRFAVNWLDPDCRIIDDHGMGPFSVERMTFSGMVCANTEDCPSASPTCDGNPVLHFQATPHPPDSTTNGEQILVRGNYFNMRNKSLNYPGGPTNPWDPIKVLDNGTYNFGRLTSFQNSCGSEQGQGTCAGLAGGMEHTSAGKASLDTFPLAKPGHATFCPDCKADPSSGDCVLDTSPQPPGAWARRVGSGGSGVWKCDTSSVLPASTQVLTNKDLTDPSNTFPASLVTLTGSQSLTNKDLSSGNTFPASLATLTGTQTLTHKDLTDPTNVFPASLTAKLAVFDVHATSTAASPTPVAWSNMPSALTELYGNAARRRKIDLTGFAQFRLEAVQVVAGSASAKLRAEYSANGGSSWSDLAAVAGAGDLLVATGGTQTNPALNVGATWASIDSAAKADVLIRIVGLSGNGNADPSWDAIRIQVK